jgi:hypothetical protein
MRRMIASLKLRHEQNLETVVERKLFSHEFHSPHGAIFVVNADQYLSHCLVLPFRNIPFIQLKRFPQNHINIVYVLGSF